jgi:hypothetical protein
MTQATLGEIRQRLDERLAERPRDRARLEQIKKDNARVIRRAEVAKRILEKA